MSSICENNNMLYENVTNNAQKNVSTTKKDTNIINNNKDSSSNYELKKEKTINEVWTKDHFNNRKLNKHELNLNLKGTKMSWTNKINKNDDDIDLNDEDDDDDDVNVNEDNDTMSPAPSTPDKDNVTSPSHYARRPMNAFLIFCKKHRPIVRKEYPNLENRGVTRILGEWWAFLEEDDKKCYTALAKEYKDAFFLANPNFKWYKLPAPPLRTLSTRPLTVQRDTSPLQSPSESLHIDAQFTPGKLADESQLGMLSSLLKNDNNYSNKSTECDKNNKPSEHNVNTNFNNNNNNIDNNNFNNLHKENDLKISHKENEIKDTAVLPLKPLKKRFFDQLDNNYEEYNNTNPTDTKNDEEDNITKQELYDKVVDSMFPTQTNGRNKTKETRKSGRACKGKRYEQFMVHGKLLKNKREKKMASDFNCGKMDSKFESELICNNDDFTKIENQTPRLDLGNTIKRLAERTKTKLENNDNKRIKLEIDNYNNKQQQPPIDDRNSDNFQNSYFDLDLRIEKLPYLSYENYLKRKRESKKRKQFKSKSIQNSNYKHKGEHTNNNNKIPVGSKKRKNKNNITHLEKNVNNKQTSSSVQDTDLSGLTTLAEIAANKERINE